MTSEELIKEIAVWCARNGAAQSRFLTPYPVHHVSTFGLFDWLSDLGIVSQGQIAKWFNEEQERLENE